LPRLLLAVRFDFDSDGNETDTFRDSLPVRRMKQKSNLVKTRPMALVKGMPQSLLADVRELILEARTQTAQAVNASLTLLYWQIGRRIRIDVLKEKRAEYGQKIFYALSGKLTEEFGRGYSERNLANMVRFAEVFPDPKILHALRAKLGWTHFRQIIYLDDPLKRDFYAELCRIENWSTRTLENKIGSMLFERTALSKKPDKLIRQELADLREEDKLTPDLVFRDPYILDFLQLKDTCSEKNVETAILREMESFILELGDGFCFVARQKRMQIDDADYYLDLLFYHRKLHRLVAIDLKLRNFEAGDKGQMELYLNWLKRHECEAGEASPLGIILCAGQRAQHVELLKLEKSGIHVASYWTKVLPKKLLEQKLHDAVRLARMQLGAPQAVRANG